MATGHVCAVKNCLNKRSKTDAAFYKFPKDPQRARVWAIAAGREDLLHKIETLCNSHRICEIHFESCCFMNAFNNRLLPCATPTIFPTLKESNIDHTYSVVGVQNSQSVQIQDSMEKSTPPPKIIVLENLIVTPDNGKQAAVEMEKMDSTMDITSKTSCRACANTCVPFYSINSRICNFTTTIKDMIVLLVPQMESELNDDDVICSNCRKILGCCVRFIDRCLRVEADRKENILDQKPSFTNLEDDDIKVTGDHFDEDQNDSTSLTEDANIDVKTNEVMDFKRENNQSISSDHLQIDLVKELPSSILNNNRLITATQLPINELNEFISTLASNDVITLQYSQDSTRTTEKKRVILVGSTFKCKKCTKYFESKGKYARHIRGHLRLEHRRAERERMRKLKIQESEENKCRNLEDRMNPPRRKKRIKPVEFKCKTCSEKFSSAEDQKLHLEIHPPFVCEKCGKGFAGRNQANAHKSVHNDPNSYVCEVCGKAYKSMNQLRQHKLLHANTVHSCNRCPKVFKTIYGIRRHNKYTHGEGLTRSWPCKECGKIFKSSRLYLSHYRQMHLRDGNKKCDVCGQGFYRSDYLKRHKRRHLIYGEILESFNNAAESQTNESVSNEKTAVFRRRNQVLPPGPYQCQICMKLYKQLYSLKSHILTHGPCRFNCKFCSRTFKKKYLKIRHEKTHGKCDSLRKYRCESCWKRFETREELDQHALAHDNLKYICGKCGESFAREYLFNDHIANVHEENGDAEEEMRILMAAGLGTTLYDIINKI